MTARGTVAESGRDRTAWLSAARKAWYLAATTAFGIWLAALPGFVVIGSRGIYDSRFSANPSPLFRALSWSVALGAAGTGLLSLCLAVLLFRRRANDRVALSTSFFLLVYGVIMAGTLEALEPFVPGIAGFTTEVLIPIVFPFGLWLFAVFPDGRFVPHWARWGVVAAFLTVPFLLVWSSLFSGTSLDFNHPVVLLYIGLAVVLAVAIWSCTLYAQICRYRREASTSQKQQIKWVGFGLSVWFVAQFVSSIPWLYAYSLPRGTPIPLWLAAATPLWILSVVSIPLTLTVAILRYRLFEIDFLINRSLVFGALTVAVIALYVLIVGALGLFFQTQGSLPIALLATGLVAALFQPLREQLQQGINRLVYGERHDPFEALARLGRQLETSLPADELLPRLVETIARTLKLPYVAIRLSQTVAESAAEYGKTTADAVRLPLVFQGEDVGQLVVGLRSPGTHFSPTEMRLLRNIARQAGTTVHAARLTVDLLHSRQQLITAREEERRRLRRDLHDGLGATLAALHLEAGVLRHSIRTDPDRSEALVDELRQDIRTTIEDIRHLVYQLRPPLLDQLGLVEALRALASQRGENGAHDVPPALQIRVEAPEPMPALPAAVEVAVFRIVQEALTNVVTHAQAKRCTVCLDVETVLRVEVVDDGVGFNRSEKLHGGIGIHSMRERAEELGGGCLVESVADGGTRVLATLPLLEA